MENGLREINFAEFLGCSNPNRHLKGDFRTSFRLIPSGERIEFDRPDSLSVLHPHPAETCAADAHFSARSAEDT